jgi:hypothetical protein
MLVPAALAALVLLPCSLPGRRAARINRKTRKHMLPSLSADSAIPHRPATASSDATAGQ